MAVPIKKGTPFDCSMYDVRCSQECVSGGVRHTDKCPYDNFRKKGADTMAKNTTKPAADSGNQNSNNFQPTFRKYSDMSETEKAAFRQGAKTSENKVKERLGFVKPKN